MEGHGFCHFNNNLLTDIDFVNACKKTIKTTVTEYALDGSIPSHLTTQQITDLPSTLKPPALLDIILCKSRQTAMNFMAEKKRKEGQVIKNLETEQKNLNDHIYRASRRLGVYKERALAR